MTAKTDGVSIVVCTYRRPRELARLLPGLAAQRLEGVPACELIVVDNSPEGGVAEPVWTAPFPLRIVHEPRPGLSCARNTGVAEARFGVVAFLDDDVALEPQWLAALFRTFADPGVAIVAGRVLPRFPGASPRWLDARALSDLSCLDLGDAVLAVEADQVIGANFAVRREAVLAVGGFDSRLGRYGRNLLSGDETRIARAVAATGGRLVYAPDAWVWHCIAEERLSRLWHLKRAYWGGRTAASMGGPAVNAADDAPLSVAPAKPWIVRFIARRRAGGSLFAEARHLAWCAGKAWQRWIGPPAT